MARFKKKNFFKKQDPHLETEEIKKFERKQPETVIVEESNSIHKSSSRKSLIKTGTKYAYIIAAAALLSGIFTPFTIGVEPQNVIFGILILFIGVGGGVLIFKGVIAEKTSTILVCIGLSFMTISLVLIFQIVSTLRAG